MVTLGGRGLYGSRLRVTRVVLSLIGLVFFGTATADWEPAAAVDNAPAAPFGATFGTTTVSVGANGTTTALFLQKGAATMPASGNGSPFVLRRAAGAAAWSAPAAISTPTAGAAPSSIALASKADGSAAGLFGFRAVGTTADQALASIWPAGAPAPAAAVPVLCTAGATPLCATTNLHVTFDGAGIAYAVGSSGSNQLFARTDVGGNWQPATLLKTGADLPNLAVDSAGNVVVVYAAADKLNGRRMSASATVFDAEVQLSGQNKVDGTSPSQLVMDAAGTVTVTFLESSNPNLQDYSVRAVRWPLGAVPMASQTLSVSTAGSIINPGALAVDPQGRVTAAWFSARAFGDGTIYAAQLLSGNTFGAATQVSPANSSNTYSGPQLAVDDAGTLTMIYSDHPTPAANLALVAQRKPVGAPWSALTTISAASGAGAIATGSPYRVASRFPGQADVTFVQALSGTNRLFATRFTTPDTTKPTILIISPANAATFAQGQVVNADYACMDEAGGSGLKTCAGNVPTGQPIDTATAGAKTFTVNAEDNAGNKETKAVNYTVTAAPDTTPPVITLTTPADGATFTVGQVVNASYMCTDNAGGSGNKTCTGTVANGTPIDTATAGSKNFTVNASDNANNTVTRTVSYTVTAAPSSGGTTPVTTVPASRSGALDLLALFGLMSGVWVRRRRGPSPAS